MKRKFFLREKVLLYCKVSFGIERPGKWWTVIYVFTFRPSPGQFRNNLFVYNKTYTKETNVSHGFNTNTFSSDKFLHN